VLLEKIYYLVRILFGALLIHISDEYSRQKWSRYIEQFREDELNNIIIVLEKFLKFFMKMGFMLMRRNLKSGLHLSPLGVRKGKGKDIK